MQSRRSIRVVGCHAEGEVGDVIVDGVEPPPGETLWEQSRFIANDQTLRNFVLNEPRGGLCRHVNLLVPARDPRAAFGFIIMEPTHTPPMSGSNSMCVATVLLETGRVEMTEPTTHLTLEAPGGLVEIEAQCRAGKAERITVTNVPSFAARLDAPLEVEGLGTLQVDTAYGGDSFVMVDAAALGFAITPSEGRELAETGARITRAANEQLGFVHPQNDDWRHISFCQLAGPLERSERGLTMRNTVVIDPGRLDRSPTGTGASARMAVLRARGIMAVGDSLTMRSVIDSEFVGRIVGDVTVGDMSDAAVTGAGHPAIIPTVSGRAWITGTHEYTLDPLDPWPAGYRISDTWPE